MYSIYYTIIIRWKKKRRDSDLGIYEKRFASVTLGKQQCIGGGPDFRALKSLRSPPRHQVRSAVRPRPRRIVCLGCSRPHTNAKIGVFSFFFLQLCDIIDCVLL